jgi:hypothetical protein
MMTEYSLFRRVVISLTVLLTTASLVLECVYYFDVSRTYDIMLGILLKCLMFIVPSATASFKHTPIRMGLFILTGVLNLIYSSYLSGVYIQKEKQYLLFVSALLFTIASILGHYFPKGPAKEKTTDIAAFEVYETAKSFLVALAASCMYTQSASEHRVAALALLTTYASSFPLMKGINYVLPYITTSYVFVKSKVFILSLATFSLMYTSMVAGEKRSTLTYCALVLLIVGILFEHLAIKYK